MAINHSFDVLRVRPIGPRRVGQCGALLGLLLAGACWTQSRADTTTPRAASTDLEEITVTATRREQSADTVPISITAFSQNAWTNRASRPSTMCRDSPRA